MFLLADLAPPGPAQMVVDPFWWVMVTSLVAVFGVVQGPILWRVGDAPCPQVAGRVTLANALGVAAAMMFAVALDGQAIAAVSAAASYLVLFVGAYALTARQDRGRQALHALGVGMLAPLGTYVLGMLLG